MAPAEIDLRDAFFTESVRPLLGWSDDLSAETFRYASGVAALRVRNAVGELVWLPFHGQQIWDAAFHGRRLTMGSLFDAPVATETFTGNYGGFLLHCGAASMGNPGPEDRHPLHGELPNARYQEAWLRLGEDARGRWLELAGRREHIEAFALKYEARPSIRIYSGDARLGLRLEIRNLKSTPMPLMYLAHINFRPVDGATLEDAVPDTKAAIRLRTALPDLFEPSPAHRRLVAELEADIAAHRRIAPGRPIDPELVMGLDARADAGGWAHALQALPDGAADFVSWRPVELDHAVRWLTRTGDQEALGVALPATAEADGFAAEKAKGNVKSLGPGETFAAAVEFGALTPEEAAPLRERLRSAKGG